MACTFVQIQPHKLNGKGLLIILIINLNQICKSLTKYNHVYYWAFKPNWTNYTTFQGKRVTVMLTIQQLEKEINYHI